MTVENIVYLRQKMIDIAKYHNATNEEAEDVTHDLFIKLKEIEIKDGNIDKIFYKGNVNMVYIFNAIRNMVYNIKNKTNRSVCIDDIIPMSTHEPSLVDIEVQEQLLDMGRYYHSLYDAYFNDNISMRKLAQETSISLTTIFYDLKYIKGKLKPILS